MRIAVDIGHPAHVHYFRGLIRNFSYEGHEFFVTACERGEVFACFDGLEIPYTGPLDVVQCVGG